MKSTKSILSLAAGLALALTGSLSAKDTWYVSDHLATTVASIDVAGEIAQIEADAFGTPLGHDGTIGNPERYTGKPYDEDLGAYVFPFRNYRPEEGRWMSNDPSGFPDGINPSTYYPNPNTAIDPYGLAQQIVETLVVTTITYTINNAAVVGGTLAIIAAGYATGGAAWFAAGAAGFAIISSISSITTSPSTTLDFYSDIPDDHVLIKTEMKEESDWSIDWGILRTVITNVKASRLLYTYGKE
ncbi:MAG: RHS repeat-associated core domain-containing protein [Opitutaceae bacterium]|jgi:RHS repeat-associated protein|nr:RHS repeat-associated core domain-containing protein [Opitutaceae bacterium]